MVVTIQDFALEMGMNPNHLIGLPVTGDTSCGDLTCAQINKMVSDIAWAESMIDSALRKYGLSLYYRQETLSGDAPYLWKKGAMVPGKLVTLRKSSTIVTNLAGDVATVQIGLSEEEFDVICDKVVAVEFHETCSGACPNKLQPKWRELNAPEEGDGLYLTLETDAYALTECACDGSGCEVIEHATFDVVILKPSAPRMGSYSNGCDVVETTCAECGGYSTTEGCIVKESDRMVTASFDVSCCGCGGSKKIYEFDVVIPPVEYNSQLWNAIISLANTRKALLGCEFCSPESQERIRLDVGIITGEIDMRAKSPYLFSNPFGIFAPGALSAWRVVADKISGLGGAGHF